MWICFVNLQTKATSGYYSWLPPFFVCLNFDAHLPSCRTIPNWSVNRGLRVNFTCCQHQHLRGILKPNPISVATIDIPQNTIIQFWFIGQKNHFSNPHFEKSLPYSSFANWINQINISVTNRLYLKNALFCVKRRQKASQFFSP